MKEHIPQSLKIGNSVFTNIEIITNRIIEGNPTKKIECSVDKFDIVSCLLTINLRQDGKTSYYHYLNFDEWNHETRSSIFKDLAERIPIYHGQVTIGGHDKIYHRVSMLQDEIFIFKFFVRHDILDHFIKEGPELYKQYENAGKPEDWWKQE